MESPLAFPESRVASYFSDLSSKLEELKEVYQINSILMKQRDEEIETLKQQLLSATSKLVLNTSQLDKASSQLELLKAELEKTNESLEQEKLSKLKAEETLRLKEIELQYAKENIEAKDEEISELLDQILERPKSHESRSEVESNSSVNEEEDLDEDIVNKGEKELESSDWKFDLSPIPEENIDEIPDYYDECNAYISSLRIWIGSDSNKLSELDDHGFKDQKNPRAKKRGKSTTGSSSLVNSESSDKKSSVEKCKRKRRRFSVLFQMAQY